MPRKQRFRNVGAGKGVKQQLDPETLRHLYLEDGLTQAMIADHYGCTPQFISLLLAEYGIRTTSQQKEGRTRRRKSSDVM
jgi:hypothetical protein